eukprot:3341603-Rhodomonas_salina.1
MERGLTFHGTRTDIPWNAGLQTLLLHLLALLFRAFEPSSLSSSSSASALARPAPRPARQGAGEGEFLLGETVGGTRVQLQVVPAYGTPTRCPGGAGARVAGAVGAAHVRARAPARLPQRAQGRGQRRGRRARERKVRRGGGGRRQAVWVVGAERGPWRGGAGWTRGQAEE